MLEHAPAKVNLYLHVTGRRPDGYHLLDSLAVFGPAADTLVAEPAEKLTLVLDGPFGEALEAEPDNLVLRAARALGARGAALRLTKRLPVASGIGGGSADAAAALRLLNRLWGTGRDEAALAALAAPLGADIPVCVASRPAVMQGVGELIRPSPGLPECGLLLVNPLIPLATPAVFRARQGGFSPPATLPEAWPDAAAMADDLGRLTNDLEAPALSLCPVIAEVLSALRAQPGCLLARMSGSGATCFGLFATSAGAQAAARVMPSTWWASGGGLYGAGAASLHPGIGGV
jgi:4-diphosphocytidyl-2-C-methyl-D-erythritol kinase